MKASLERIPFQSDMYRHRRFVALTAFNTFTSQHSQCSQLDRVSMPGSLYCREDTHASCSNTLIANGLGIELRYVQAMRSYSPNTIVH
jgi:hypothetical protein